MSPAAPRPSDLVQVWRAARALAGPQWHALLDDVERRRLAMLQREEDQQRFLLGCAVVRSAVGRCLSIPPGQVVLDRRCPDCGKPHGRIRVPGLHVSVSHSGDWVLVAVLRDAPVGVDVEALDPTLDTAGVAQLALAPAEVPTVDAVEDFARYWCRKEALVKMTGDGLRADLTRIVVSSPHQPPRLLAWAARPDLVGGCQLHDLDLDARHRACVAYQSPVPLRVEQLDAADLLGG